MREGEQRTNTLISTAYSAWHLHQSKADAKTFTPIENAGAENTGSASISFKTVVPIQLTCLQYNVKWQAVKLTWARNSFLLVFLRCGYVIHDEQ